MTRKDLTTDQHADDAAKARRASPANKSARPKRPNRKVKFAEPLAQQRTYDKASSPRVEIETKPATSKSHSKSELDDLKPPLSLVAQLDLAAHKLNARQGSRTGTQDDLSIKSAKSQKSIKSVRSSKSISSHSPATSPSTQDK